MLQNGNSSAFCTFHAFRIDVLQRTKRPQFVTSIENSVNKLVFSKNP